MTRFAKSRGAARLSFIIGLFLMFLGSSFLIGSPPEIPRAMVHVSFVLLAAGAGFAVLALRISRRPLYLFFAALFLQVGLFLFLTAIGVVPIRFSGAWPLLSIFAGVALLPAGWHRYGTVRPSYVVLAAAFIVLGSLLLVFSLNMVGFSFAQFVLEWWPLLILAAGLVMILAALSSRIGVHRRAGGRGKRGRG